MSTVLNSTCSLIKSACKSIHKELGKRNPALISKRNLKIAAAAAAVAVGGFSVWFFSNNPAGSAFKSGSRVPLSLSAKCSSIQKQPSPESSSSWKSFLVTFFAGHTLGYKLKRSIKETEVYNRVYNAIFARGYRNAVNAMKKGDAVSDYYSDIFDLLGPVC